MARTEKNPSAWQRHLIYFMVLAITLPWRLMHSEVTVPTGEKFTFRFSEHEVRRFFSGTLLHSAIVCHQHMLCLACQFAVVPNRFIKQQDFCGPPALLAGFDTFLINKRVSSRRLGMAHTCLGKFRMAPQMLRSLNLRAQLKASCQAVLLSGTVTAKHWTARTCGGWCGQLHITPRVYRSNLQDIYTRWNRKIIESTLINDLFSVQS